MGMRHFRSEGCLNFVDFCRLVVSPEGPLQESLKSALKTNRENAILLGADATSKIGVEAFTRVLQDVGICHTAEVKPAIKVNHHRFPLIDSDRCFNAGSCAPT